MEHSALAKGVTRRERRGAPFAAYRAFLSSSAFVGLLFSSFFHFLFL